jgi:hypothetical protein
MKKLILFSCLLLIGINEQIHTKTWQSKLVKIDSKGNLTYVPDSTGNVIPDFSYAGYQGGGVAIPTIPVVLTISPVAGDNTANIQTALNLVGQMTTQANGFRGALLLNPGLYPVQGSLSVNQSGVVLRGSGNGTDATANTIIYATGNTPPQRNIIMIGGGKSTLWSGQVAGTQKNITTSFLRVGSRSLQVSDTAGLSVGDNIIIYHPCTSAWLQAVRYGDTASDPDWTVGLIPLVFNTRIQAIQGNTLTLASPVFNNIDQSLSQAYLYKYDSAGLVQNVGIENLRVDLQYNLNNPYDENHAWNCIRFTQVENGWATNCVTTHFGLAGIMTETANYLTIDSCSALDPISTTTVGRKYNFNCHNASSNILFKNCLATNGRHSYVSDGASTVSGIVFLRNTSQNPFEPSEGHRWWSMGLLYDNHRDYGTTPPGNWVIGLYNRGDMGTSHGWSAVHSVVWNANVTRSAKGSSSTGFVLVQQPPTAQNYAIGCTGSVTGNGPYKFAIGYNEGTNNAGLTPASLYEAQLAARLSKKRHA